jgi:hypothetical protein
MIASFAVIVLSTGLLLYWFRYTCILLLRNGAVEVREASAAVQRNFSYGDVQNQLQSEVALDPLRRSLQRDYEVLTYLVRHASGLEFSSFEERLLLWDYRLMQAWYSIAKIVAPEQARAAVGEMAAVLGILAGRIGQRAGVHGQV